MAEQATPSTQSSLVVIGASAGGIPALSTLVSTLPADFPAPIVIAQHLDPSRVSHLQEILTRHSGLPVRTVTERAALDPGVIFVVPANRNVEVTDHDLHLRIDQQGPRPSVDLLFRSAAQVYGQRLIAVILTGSGSDGAAGAWTVKQLGGTVIIQDPDTAPYPSMPLSLAPSIVDVTAPLEQIGPMLYNLTTDGFLATLSNRERDLQRFFDHVRERTGIDFGAYKTSTMQRRLQRRMVATNAGTLEDYLRYLDSHAEEYQRLVSTFLIKVTEFFRDGELFDYLRAQILPDIVAGAGGAREHDPSLVRGLRDRRRGLFARHPGCRSARG